MGSAPSTATASAANPNPSPATTTVSTTTGETVRFRHGGPSVPFDDAIGCFKAVGYVNRVTKGGAIRSVTTTTPPGYLYRLVNAITHQWHFYNDTTSYDFVVTGYFGCSAETALRPMGTARMYREIPSELYVVELTVGPLETAPYLEGIIRDGFDIHFTAVPRNGRVSRSASPPSSAAIAFRDGSLVQSVSRTPSFVQSHHAMHHHHHLQQQQRFSGGGELLTAAGGPGGDNADPATVAFCPHCYVPSVVRTPASPSSLSPSLTSAHPSPSHPSAASLWRRASSPLALVRLTPPTSRVGHSAGWGEKRLSNSPDNDMGNIHNIHGGGGGGGLTMSEGHSSSKNPSSDRGNSLPGGGRDGAAFTKALPLTAENLSVLSPVRMDVTSK